MVHMGWMVHKPIMFL